MIRRSLLALAGVLFVALQPQAAQGHHKGDHAAPGHLLVPVELSGLPAEANLATVNCYVTDADGNNVAGGNGQSAISGGRLSTTLTVGLARVAGAAGGTATSYNCRLIVGAQTADGQALQFWSTTAVTNLGWPNVFATGARTYMPRAAGSALAFSVRGTLTPAEANAIAPAGTTACPCGCGGVTGTSSSACSSSRLPTAPTISSAGRATPSGPTPGRLPEGLRASSAPPAVPVTPVSITTPHFAFTGTGVFVRR